MQVSNTALSRLQEQFAQKVLALAPFDAGAWIGRPFQAHRAYLQLPELQAALEEAGIARALVSHTRNELYDPQEQDQPFAAALQAAGLPGVMTAAPPDSAGPGASEVLLHWGLANGFRALRLMPKAHRYSLRNGASRMLLQAMEARRFPLFIAIGQTSWAEIGAVAQAHPLLPILVEGMGHHEFLNVRDALPLLETTPNLYVPTNRQFLCGGLELFIERLGLQRVLFASNQPIDDPYAALGPLVYSDLPLQDLKAVAYENLDRLLNGILREDV